MSEVLTLRGVLSANIIIKHKKAGIKISALPELLLTIHCVASNWQVGAPFDDNKVRFLLLFNT
jgi:hypothetical protein